ncbi:heavy-metal-associated domain-containing protein [Kordia sp. YSTF-M3]|uniref:Heavy-metal-associated domain-containing protein n=1 Tax=Kordia aestuariivivens TaxID=2759037 RepID=A0ABR7QEX8_9FLAO|nr:heavy-metal-associated domain-containing protein [Kordia aestuariivivens]MBC8757102.1 heavy-metal-associated domain-containing protein [Kordia aestuariivivens]
MKKVILSLLAVVSLTVISCKNEAKTDVKTTTEQGKDLAVANFGVRGNCGMCKTTIEKAAKSVDGVAEATWDIKKKSIQVSYDAAKANETDLREAIADAGYDTDKEKGNKLAYKKLPKCCQYSSEMEMNQ